MLGCVHFADAKVALAGHSDADVVSHAICDALLGAAAMGDIGMHFPDTEAEWKDAAGETFLRHVAAQVRGAGYAPSTMSLPRVARHFTADIVSHPSRLAPGAGAALLEATGRALGAWDHFVARRSHAVWDIAATTKNVSES